MAGRGGSMPGFRTVFFIAVRQLWARKGLNSIAMGGVVLGVLVLIVLNGIMSGLHEKFTQAILCISPHVIVFDTELRAAPSMIERFEGGPTVSHVSHQSPPDRQARISRPKEVARTLLAMPGVVAAAPSIDGTVLMEYGGKTRGADVRGIDPVEQEKVTTIAPFIIAGKLASLKTETDGIVVGSGLATFLGLHVGDVVRVSSEYGEPLNLRVVAIYEAGVPAVDKARCFVLLRNGQAVLGRQDAISRIEVRIEDPELAPKYSTSFEHVAGYDAESWQETNANFLSAFKMQDTVVAFVIAALLLVGGFGILAVQIMIVLQKQRDIAILRSFGMRRFDILFIFLLQGFAISLSGGLIGDALGKVLLKFLSTLKVHMEGGAVKSDTFLIAENTRFYFYGLAFALLVGMTAALIPAWRGAKVEPVDVLRGQTG